MNFQDYTNFANETRLCYVATADGDQPKVRILGMWYADNTGFYFQTQSSKPVYSQVKSNPKVELCFYAGKDTDAAKAGTVMRVCGKARIIEDMATKTRAFNERNLGNFGITGPEDPLIGLFHVYTGEAHFFTMADNMKEAQIERVKF